MRKISKGPIPAELHAWMKANPSGSYSKLSDIERCAIRLSATAEQYYICAYCCCEISGSSSDTVNEHIKSQKHFPNLTLDYSNIVASCTSNGQCDNSHGSNDFELTPLMNECEDELKFYISGRIEGLTDRAKAAITILNLGDSYKNNKSLVEKRKYLISATLFSYGVIESDLLDDPELLSIVVSELNRPLAGKLQSFAPAISKALQSLA